MNRLNYDLPLIRGRLKTSVFMGIDFAGVVERVAPGERDFHTGDP
jgi:NADPH:quinone reductase-like Zn-dependent oxidoreductase